MTSIRGTQHEVQAFRAFLSVGTLTAAHLYDQHTHGDGSQQVFVVIQPLLYLVIATLKTHTHTVMKLFMDKLRCGSLMTPAGVLDLNSLF